MESEDLEVIVKSKDDFNLARKLSPDSPHTLYCLGYVIYYHDNSSIPTSLSFLKKFFHTCLTSKIKLSSPEEVGQNHMELISNLPAHMERCS